MRSGSTLLKALIATRPDASNLPEIPFCRIAEIESEKEILVIKKPAYYTDLDYPELPPVKSKIIILIRDPYDTVISLKNMNDIMNKKNANVLNNERFLISYWYMVYKNIFNKFSFTAKNILLVKYEEIVNNPIEISKKIFEFIGSIDSNGIDSYEKPRDFKWVWGNDDGGEIIRTLKVQKIERQRTNFELLKFINSNQDLRDILSAYGYNLN